MRADHAIRAVGRRKLVRRSDSRFGDGHAVHRFRRPHRPLERDVRPYRCERTDGGEHTFAVETLFDGFDVDADQCTVLFAGLDKLGLTNMCADVRPDFLAVPGNFFDARFLPNGNILAASRGVVLEVDRRGAAVRSFITSQSDYGLLAIDPDGTSFRTTANNRQFRFDLNTGNPLAPPAWLRNAVYGTRSMAIRGEWRAALHTKIGRRSMRR